MLRKTFVVLTGLGLLAAGCSKPTPTSETPVAQQQAQAPQTGVRGEDHRQLAPLVVKLVAVSENAATGETELRADFDAREALSYPLALTLVPPAGAIIVAGNATESMNVPAAGRFSKSFKIRTQGPLTQDAPVKLVVHGGAPDGSGGLHAEPRYPAVIDTGVPPRQGPSVPGGRPPMPTRR